MEFYNEHLRSAAAKGHVCGVRALLEVGANPNSKDRTGNPALHWAAFPGLADVCSALLARPDFTEVNAKDYWEETALQCAANRAVLLQSVFHWSARRAIEQHLARLKQH